MSAGERYERRGQKSEATALLQGGPGLAFGDGDGGAMGSPGLARITPSDTDTSCSREARGSGTGSASRFRSDSRSSLETSRGGICAMRASTRSTCTSLTTGMISGSPSTGFALASFSAVDPLDLEGKLRYRIVVQG